MQVTADAVPKEDKGYHEKAMRESLKLWETFAESYTTLFVNTMEKSVQQSETLQKQMGAAVEQMMKPWFLMSGTSPQPVVVEPAPPSSSTTTETDLQILQTLAALQAQIQTLTNKVEQLERPEPLEQAASRNKRT